MTRSASAHARKFLYSFGTLGLAALVVLLAPTAAHADAAPEYDSIPAIYPPSFASLGYQATSTSEFGDHISLAGTDRVLTSVTVGLTDWACESDYTLTDGAWIPAAPNTPCTTTPGSSFTHPITVTLYAVDTSGPTPVAGASIASRTQTVTVPFRPSASPGVGPGACGASSSQWYNAATDSCHNGFAFNVDFDFSALGPILPTEFIVTVAYNTQSYGASPIGAAGPYNSLNVSLADDAPTVGTDVNPDVVLWNTSHAGFYSDGGAGGVGTLRADTGWSDFNGLVLAVTASSAIEQPTLALPDSKPSALAATGSESGTELLVVGGVLLAAGSVLVGWRLVRRRAYAAGA